jgi:hypothetical protein
LARMRDAAVNSGGSSSVAFLEVLCWSDSGEIELTLVAANRPGM